MSLHLPEMAQLTQFKQEAQIKLQQHSCKAELMYTPDRMSSDTGCVASHICHYYMIDMYQGCCWWALK